MRNDAIIIGIDNYVPDEWKLDAAVSDALAFADWAVTKGGVTPDRLSLLLSPKPGHPQISDGKASLTIAGDSVPFVAATRANIDSLILRYAAGGETADRLFFYYAGHGSSTPGSQDDVLSEPVLIPESVTKLPDDRRELLGFSSIFGELVEVPPREQFFFIDACRDFALEMFKPPAAPPVGRYRSPLLAAGGKPSSQYIIYSTSPGRRANELTGSGVFGRHLVRSLMGETAGAATFVQAGADGKPGYELSFRSLYDYLKQKVDEDIHRLFRDNWQQFVQLPQQDSPRWAPNTVLQYLDKFPKRKLAVRISPKSAREVGNAGIVYYVPGGEETTIRTVAAPPRLKMPIEFDLTPGDYTLKITAPNHVEYMRPCRIYENCVIDVEVPPTRQASEATTATPPVEEKVLESVSELQSAAKAAASAIPEKSSLVVRAEDRLAVVVVVPPGSTEVVCNYGEVIIEPAPPGIYRAHLRQSAGTTQNELIEVKAGTKVERTLKAPNPTLAQAQINMLADIHVQGTESNCLDVSGQLGNIAGPNLASLLGYAAYAAYCAPMGVMERLKCMGLPRATRTRPEDGIAVLIIGVAGKNPAEGYNAEQFLQESFVLVGKPNPGNMRPLLLHPLSGFPAAASAEVSVKPGLYEAELRIPERAATRYTFNILSKRATVLVAVVEENGSVDVQRYLLPLDNSIQMSTDDLRVVELSQRFYAGSEDLPENLLEPILQEVQNIKRLNPFLMALAGYTLVRLNRHKEFSRPLHWLLEHLPDLPDVRVLAALCEPEKADEHFEAAARNGLPVFSEGAISLYGWLKNHKELLTPRLESAFNNLIPGSPWTAWVVRQPVVELLKQAAMPVGWERFEDKASDLYKLANAIGRIEVYEHNYKKLEATGFLIGRDLVITADFAIQPLVKDETSSASWFHRDASEPIEVKEIASISGEHSIAILRLARPVSEIQPLEIGSPESLRGTCVAVVGFSNTSANHWLAPGIINSSNLKEGMFQYDCTTLPGFSGAPIIDICSLKVVGIHLQGRVYRQQMTEESRDKIGFGLALFPLLGSPALKPLTEQPEAIPLPQSSPAISREKPEESLVYSSPVNAAERKSPMDKKIGKSFLDVAPSSLTLTIPLKIRIEIGNLSEDISISVPYSATPQAETPGVLEADLYYDEMADVEDQLEYYKGVQPGINPETFYWRLNSLLTSTHTNHLSYKPSQHLYPVVDLQPEGNILSIYSENVFSPEELIALDRVTEAALEAAHLELLALGSAPDLIDEQLERLEAALSFNCEHVVPQSWFAKKPPMKGDLHHLFSCEISCNSFRGNKPFTSFLDELVLENCGRAEGNKFEPKGGKGALSRATLYFLLRYPGNINNNTSEYRKEDLQLLLEWHRTFPVTLYEKHRNREIFLKQGNRNPLIDHPEWSTSIDFGKGLGT